MPSIFSPSDYQQLVQRFEKLTPSTPAKWGKMNVAQMLGHLQPPLMVTLGYTKSKRGFIGFLFGGMAKKKLLSGKPFSKNLPTDKSFIVTDARNFEEEKQKFMKLLHELHTKGAAGVTSGEHPFFGKMTPEDWDALSWQHFDHHLRQFGV
jgi:hypothetical protein